MTERPQQPLEVPPEPTVPGIPLQRVVEADEPTLFGLPAEVGEPEKATDDVAPLVLVRVRRADPIAGFLLVLAGVAAAASLWLPWRRDVDGTGLSLVRRGLELAGGDVRALGPTGEWQPLAIVLGGVVLFLLGVLMFGPARTHRISGLLALLVASAVAAAVLLRVAAAGWLVTRWDGGLWCAIAVAGLGLLGALKAMLTAPRVTTRWRRG
jgi:hypothetical protein